MAESVTTKGHVLIVDNEEHVTELVATGLGFTGFEVERASSGCGAGPSSREPDL